MAFKFSERNKNAGNRTIDTIVDVVVTYTGGDTDLAVPSKLVTLLNGNKGYITNERFPEMEASMEEGADDTALLPESWKVGAPKNGLPHGFFYDSAKLTSTKRVAAVTEI